MRIGERPGHTRSAEGGGGARGDAPIPVPVWLKLGAVGLLAIGPAVTFVAELFTWGPPWGLVIVGGIVAVVSAIGWKWPRAGGALLLLASALMFFLAVALIDFGHGWEEGDASWTIAEKLLVAFLGGVPLVAGALFVIAGSLAFRAPHDLPGIGARRRRVVRIVVLAAATGSVIVAWVFPLGEFSALGVGLGADSRHAVYGQTWSPDDVSIACRVCTSPSRGTT